MTRYGSMYGPDYTFLGVDRCDADDPATLADADVVIVGAPYDGGTSYRSGARFGPSAMRAACYLEHDGSRPPWRCAWTACRGPGVVDAGDVEMYSAATSSARAPDHRGRRPAGRRGRRDPAGPGRRPHRHVARRHRSGTRRAGAGRVSIIHFDAHADTGDIEFGSLVRPRPADAAPHRVGRGPRRPVPADRPARLLAGAGNVSTGWPSRACASYEMTEIVARGLDECLTEAFVIATRRLRRRLPVSVDIDVCDPGHAPGTGTPEPGGLSGAATPRCGSPHLLRAACRRNGRRRGRTARTTTRTSPPSWATAWCSRPCRRSPGGARTNATARTGIHVCRCSPTGSLASRAPFVVQSRAFVIHV